MEIELQSLFNLSSMSVVFFSAAMCLQGHQSSASHLIIIIIIMMMIIQSMVDLAYSEGRLESGTHK